MRIRIWMLALIPFAMIGCADETPPVVTHNNDDDYARGDDGRSDGRGCDAGGCCAQAPPSVRIEAQTVAPGFGGYIWDARPTGDGPEGITLGVWLLGQTAPYPRLFGVPGHWVSRGAGWIWVPGHWR